MPCRKAKSRPGPGCFTGVQHVSCPLSRRGHGNCSRHRWIERFWQLRQRYPRFSDAEAEVRAVTGIFTALSYRQPQHPDLPDWTRDTHRLIEGNLRLRLLIGSRLVPYYLWWTGDLTRAASLLDLLETQAEQDGTDPLTAIVWHAIHAMELWMTSATRKCVATAEQGLELA